MALDTYRRQNRGGKGVKGMPTKEKDFVENLLITTTHHTILFFTNRGRVYHLKAYEIAEASRTAKGTAIINLLQLEKDEKITAVIQVKGFNPDAYLFMATKKGIVKKTSLIEFKNLHKGGLNAINLDDDDELIGVKFTDGERDMILGTKWGMAIVFGEDDVRSMGRAARGVKGISLNDGDEVIGMDTLSPNAEVLTVTAQGHREDGRCHRTARRPPRPGAHAHHDGGHRHPHEHLRHLRHQPQHPGRQAHVDQRERHRRLDGRHGPEELSAALDSQ